DVERIRRTDDPDAVAVAVAMHARHAAVRPVRLPVMIVRAAPGARAVRAVVVPIGTIVAPIRAIVVPIRTIVVPRGTILVPIRAIIVDLSTSSRADDVGIGDIQHIGPNGGNLVSIRAIIVAIRTIVIAIGTIAILRPAIALATNLHARIRAIRLATLRTPLDVASALARSV